MFYPVCVEISGIVSGHQNSAFFKTKGDRTFISASAVAVPVPHTHDDAADPNRGRYIVLAPASLVEHFAPSIAHDVDITHDALPVGTSLSVTFTSQAAHPSACLTGPPIGQHPATLLGAVLVPEVAAALHTIRSDLAAGSSQGWCFGWNLAIPNTASQQSNSNNRFSSNSGGSSNGKKFSTTPADVLATVCVLLVDVSGSLSHFTAGTLQPPSGDPSRRQLDAHSPSATPSVGACQPAEPRPHPGAVQAEPLGPSAPMTSSRSVFNSSDLLCNAEPPAVLVPGMQLTVVASPFGCLAPHHFTNSVVCGTLSAVAPIPRTLYQSHVPAASSHAQPPAVMFLDMTVFPGMEGAPVFAGTGTRGECGHGGGPFGRPVGLLCVPLLRSSDGLQIPLAISLHTVLTHLSRRMPEWFRQSTPAATAPGAQTTATALSPAVQCAAQPSSTAHVSVDNLPSCAATGVRADRVKASNTHQPAHQLQQEGLQMPLCQGPPPMPVRGRPSSAALHSNWSSPTTAGERECHAHARDSPTRFPPPLAFQPGSQPVLTAITPQFLEPHHPSQPHQPRPTSGPTPARRLTADELQRCVVTIRAGTQWATGTVIPRGHILTNAHLLLRNGPAPAPANSSSRDAAATSSQSQHVQSCTVRLHRSWLRRRLHAGQAAYTVRSNASVVGAACGSSSNNFGGSNDTSSSSSSRWLEGAASGSAVGGTSEHVWVPAHVVHVWHNHLDLALLRLDDAQRLAGTLHGLTAAAERGVEPRLQPCVAAAAARRRAAGPASPPGVVAPQHQPGLVLTAASEAGPDQSSRTNSLQHDTAVNVLSGAGRAAAGAASSSGASLEGRRVLVVGHGLFGPGVGWQARVTGGNIIKELTCGGRPTMLITCAAVHSGASGGALLDADTHELLGLVTSNSRHMSGAVLPHLNFCIAVDELRPIIHAVAAAAGRGDSEESSWQTEQPWRDLDQDDPAAARIWRLQEPTVAELAADRQRHALPQKPSLVSKM